MAYEMSIEVLDGEFPARLWVEAHGDSLVEAALQCGVIEWRWQHFDWGVVLEIDFAEESGWEQFRASTAVQAALDAVPDRFSGLLIYRGKGGSSAPRMPRRPLPRSGQEPYRWSSPTSGHSSARPNRRHCKVWSRGG